MQYNRLETQNQELQADVEKYKAATASAFAAAAAAADLAAGMLEKKSYYTIECIKFEFWCKYEYI